LPPINLSQPGWKVHEGQAIWRSQQGAPEIAGEVLLAIHTDGRSLVQFIKTPLPILSAQTAPQSWQIEFIPEKRTFAGKGKPPARFPWLHLASALEGTPPPAPLHFQPGPDGGGWRLENRKTGETLTGFVGQ